MLRIILIVFYFTLISNPSYAYLGPGVGGGVIAATIGIIIAIFVALFGIIWFPLKRLIKKIRSNQDKQEIIITIINLTNQFSLIINIIIIYELSKFIKLKISSKKFEIYKKLFNLFKLNNVSDFRKELLLFKYAKLIFLNSMKVFLLFLL